MAVEWDSEEDQPTHSHQEVFLKFNINSMLLLHVRNYLTILLCMFFFSVTVVTTANEALNYEAVHSTYVQLVEPAASIEAPPKVGSDDDLTLSGTASKDPNNHVDGMTYVWTCYNVSKS